MAKAFAEIDVRSEADGLGHYEWLGLLLDRETSWRHDKRLTTRLRHAKLRQQACVEDIDYRSPRIMRSLGRTDLLILDDWGLESLDATARHDLLEILEERYGRHSTIVTSQLPVDRWHEIIADPTYADAMLDRLVHNAHRIELTGESLRKTRAKQNQKG